jgi:hypothetical protein
MVLCMLVQRLNMAFRASLQYIHSLKRFDHVSHLETSVIGASLANYAMIQLSLQGVVCLASVLFLLFCFASSAEFGIPSS